MPQQNCSNCKYWQRWSDQPNPQIVIGDCCRNAPQVFPVKDGKFLTKFPSTKHSDFCGSYRPKQAADPQHN
jgi:hypothetical protein